MYDSSKAHIINFEYRYLGTFDAPKVDPNSGDNTFAHALWKANPQVKLTWSTEDEFKNAYSKAYVNGGSHRHACLILTRSFYYDIFGKMNGDMLIAIRYVYERICGTMYYCAFDWYHLKAMRDLDGTTYLDPGETRSWYLQYEPKSHNIVAVQRKGGWRMVVVDGSNPQSKCSWDLLKLVDFGVSIGLDTTR